MAFTYSDELTCKCGKKAFLEYDLVFENIYDPHGEAVVYIGTHEFTCPDCLSKKVPEPKDDEPTDQELDRAREDLAECDDSPYDSITESV